MHAQVQHAAASLEQAQHGEGAQHAEVAGSIPAEVLPQRRLHCPLAAAAGCGCCEAHDVYADIPCCCLPRGRLACRRRGRPLCRGSHTSGVCATPLCMFACPNALIHAVNSQDRSLAVIAQQHETHAAPPAIPRQVAPPDFDITPLVRSPPVGKACCCGQA